MNKSGEVLWKTTDKDIEEIVLTSDVVIVSGKNGLYALNRNDGSKNWKLTIDEYTKLDVIPKGVNVDNKGIIYFCNEVNNTVYAVCHDSKISSQDPWPMANHDSGNTKNLNL